MGLQLFNGADTSAIYSSVRRGCRPEQIVSVQFRAKVPPVRLLDESEQWLRLRGIVGREVLSEFGISSLSIDVPAAFHYAIGLETIGTIANLLTRGGVYRKFVENYGDALTLARDFLDGALLRQYHSVEAYSCRGA